MLIFNSDTTIIQELDISLSLSLSSTSFISLLPVKVLQLLQRRRDVFVCSSPGRDVESQLDVESQESGTPGIQSVNKKLNNFKIISQFSKNMDLKKQDKFSTFHRLRKMVYILGWNWGILIDGELFWWKKQKIENWIFTLLLEDE